MIQFEIGSYIIAQNAFYLIISLDWFNKFIGLQFEIAVRGARQRVVRLLVQIKDLNTVENLGKLVNAGKFGQIFKKTHVHFQVFLVHAMLLTTTTFVHFPVASFIHVMQ